MVVLEQASQSLSAEHARTFFRSQIVVRCEQQNVPFTLVVSLGVIMLNELSNGPARHRRLPILRHVLTPDAESMLNNTERR